MKAAIVYGIEFENRTVYVGVTTTSLVQRLSAHRSAAKTGATGSPTLHAWLKTNPVYSVRVIEYVSRDSRYKRERHWIEHFGTEKHGFNRPAYKGGAKNPFCGAPGRPKGCDNPRGKDHYASKRVRNLATGEIFDSMAEAAAAAKVSVATVCLHVNGKRQSPQFAKV